MAHDSQTPPDGLDEFIVNPEDSDDPQSTRAAEGFQTIANTAPVQQALNVGQNLDNYNALVQAAMAGDPQAMEALSQHNAGIAMGSLKTPGELSGIKVVDLPPPTPIGTVTNDIRQAATFQPPAPKFTIDNTPNPLPSYGKVIRKYAEGGEVPPPGLEDFLSAPRAPAAVDQQAPGQEPAGLNDFLHEDLTQQKYGSLGQQAIAGAEGLAKGIAGPLATGAERALGVPTEDIEGRAEANPITHYGSEAVGLIAPALVTGGSSAALKGAAELTLGYQLSKLGNVAAKAVGLGEKAVEASGLLPKIGSAIVKGAIENMAFQGQDEASRFILKDPSQDIGSVAADIGLSGIIGGVAGGALGSISPLWKAANSHLTGGLLGAIVDKAGGVEGVVNSDISRTIQKAGIDIAPDVRARLEGIPEVQEASKVLEQTDTNASGMAHQAALKDYKDKLGNSMVTALGKTPEELASMPKLSSYESGKAIGNQLADEWQEQLAPLSAAYDDIRSKYGKTELLSDKVVPTEAGNVKVPGTISNIIDKIGQATVDQNWAISPSSDIMREVNRVMKEIVNVKDVDGISGYIKAISANMQKNPLDGEMMRAGGILKGILKEAEADVVGHTIGSEAGVDAAAEFAKARKDYAIQSQLKEALDSRLHAGGSTSGYAKQLKTMAQMDGESVLRRLSGAGDADLLNTLQNSFPKTAELVKQYHINNLLEKAADSAKEGQSINSANLLKGINKLSPELQAFALKPEALSHIDAVGTLLDKFNERPHNFSNTARTADKLFQSLPGSAIGIATWIATHNPLTAAIVAPLVKALGKDAPDAIKLATLKFLGSEKPINASGFKAAVDFISQTLKGESLLSKASKAVYKAGVEVVPASQLPTERQRDKLDKQLKSLQADASPLMHIGDHTGHYLPQHAEAIGQASASAVNYLNSQRPVETKAGPLDTAIPPSKAQITAYNKTLDIANKPLIVLDKIKEGTITPKDIKDLQTMYPGLYKNLSQKLTDDMTNHIAKGDTVPYKTRIGLSMFLAQPLDSSMQPASIVAAQPKPPQGQEQSPQVPKSNPKHSMTALNKLPGAYQTPLQARTQAANKRQE